MREIKFRAWDTKGEEFYPNIQNHVGNSETAFGYMIKNDRYIIEQFTGLKDKNGVDSCQSDLCIFLEVIYLPERDEIDYNFQKILLKIEWDESDFRWAFYDAINGDFYCNLADLKSVDFKIIGNIHENPELLEDNQ